MSAPQNIIAVIFDFDDTLTDDSTTGLLEQYGIDPEDFWKNRMKELVDAGWDPTPAYMKLILDNVGKGKPFGDLTNKDLRAFGAKLDFYPGIPGLFNDLRRIAKQHPLTNPVVEYYVISGGLEDVIRGSKIAHHLNGIWGCRFATEDPNDKGPIRHIKNVVSFTEKTKHVFEINKGLASRQSPYKPYSVNDGVDDRDRRVPFDNMIYVGDGLTDVPCFSLIQKFGGKAFGIFDTKKDGSPKKAWEKLVVPKRVTNIHFPRYRKNDELGALLRLVVNEICLRMDSRTQTA